jgi:hypothetical protein
MGYQIIDPEKIENMLFDNAEYVAEFCEAGIISFEEFIENYSIHLMDRNMEDLRKAGHKIKPGAQMMGADEVIEEYENAKKLLNDDATKEALEESVNKMKKMCAIIQDELNRLAESRS